MQRRAWLPAGAGCSHAYADATPCPGDVDGHGDNRRHNAR